LGLVNGKVEREPRVARTKQQLQPHEPDTRYERTVHGQLSMVDVLEKIGISRHFASETKSILDEIYRYSYTNPFVKINIYFPSKNN
jgi:hypothetical protein